MLNLHLIRHGQTFWNAERRVQGHSESELDASGQQQARSRQSLVEALNVKAIYCSSSVRTRQTQALLTENIDLPVTYLDSLKEIHLGPWETRLWDEVEAEAGEQVANFRHRPDEFALDGAESIGAMQERGVQAIREIIETEQSGEVLIVSHGAIIKSILVHVAEVPLADIWEDPVLSNCSHSTIHVTPALHQVVTRIDNQHYGLKGWRSGGQPLGTEGQDAPAI